MRLPSSRPLALAVLCLAGTTVSLSAQRPAAKAAAKPAAAAPAKLGPGTYAIFDTSKGKFTAVLYAKEAPKSVANFIALAEGKHVYKDPRLGSLSTSKVYDGLLFFRTIPGFMLQTGDLLNNGEGRLGYTIPWEKNALKFDQPGRMALAQAPGDPASRGSQIFFALKAEPALDNQDYLVIGQIVSGLDVADALSEGPRKNGASDLPAYPNILNHVTIQTLP